jgi:hypothetical protein
MIFKKARAYSANISLNTASTSDAVFWLILSTENAELIKDTGGTLLCFWGILH